VQHSDIPVCPDTITEVVPELAAHPDTAMGAIYELTAGVVSRSVMDRHSGRRAEKGIHMQLNNNPKEKLGNME